MMTKQLTGLLAALLLLAACGKQPEAPAPQPSDQAAGSVPAKAAEPVDPPSQPDQAPGAADGETVEAAAPAAGSPVTAAVASNTAPAPASGPLRWKQGQHFAALPVAQPVDVSPGQVEVVEVFWYGCGHCYTLEPHLQAWERAKPSWIQLKRLPVIWNEVTREDARLYYTIEALGLVESLHHEVFRELHVNRRPITVMSGNRVDVEATEKAARNFLVSRGVKAEDFARHYRSFATESKLRQAENLVRRYLADHTPMMVVHGKYTTGMSMAGGLETLFQVVNDLAARERGSA